ncbi:MAG: hypothetical protein MHM6MM_002225 [Cercozoa sp. M6MM]
MKLLLSSLLAAQTFAQTSSQRYQVVQGEPTDLCAFSLEAGACFRSVEVTCTDMAYNGTVVNMEHCVEQCLSDNNVPIDTANLAQVNLCLPSSQVECDCSSQDPSSASHHWVVGEPDDERFCRHLSLADVDSSDVLQNSFSGNNGTSTDPVDGQERICAVRRQVYCGVFRSDAQGVMTLVGKAMPEDCSESPRPPALLTCDADDCDDEVESAVSYEWKEKDYGRCLPRDSNGDVTALGSEASCTRRRVVYCEAKLDIEADLTPGKVEVDELEFPVPAYLCPAHEDKPKYEEECDCNDSDDEDDDEIETVLFLPPEQQRQRFLAALGEKLLDELEDVVVDSAGEKMERNDDAIVGDFNLRVFLKKALANLQVDARQQMLEQLQDIIDDVAKDLGLAPGSAIVDAVLVQLPVSNYTGSSASLLQNDADYARVQADVAVVASNSPSGTDGNNNQPSGASAGALPRAIDVLSAALGATLLSAGRFW